MGFLSRLSQLSLLRCYEESGRRGGHRRVKGSPDFGLGFCWALLFQLARNWVEMEVVV